MGPITNVFSNHSNRYLLLALLCCFAYGYIGYFTTRSEFYVFIVILGLTFAATCFIIQKSQFSFRQMLLLALVYRLVLIFTVPNLSQDFFRFFWDGQLMLNGVNPYLQNVKTYFDQSPNYIIHQAEVLREGMGSLNAGHYSNYPPFSQLLYMISAWFAKASILTFIASLRMILIGFDLAFIYFGRKILLHFNKNPKAIFWYALNPLCILEITANLHLEGVMIAMFIASIYLLLQHKYLISGVLLSLSVGTKLLSLLALPLLVVYLWRNNHSTPKYKSISKVLLGFILVLILQFLPFFNLDFVSNFSESIGLWFNKFEFNASIYYLVRWIGFQNYGYNIIQTYGLVMPLVALVIFLYFIFNTKTVNSLLENFLWMLTVYFLLSTTVHPWYILFPLALSTFTSYKFGLFWSFLVFLSYHAYSSAQFQENEIILSAEYTLLFSFILYELWDKKSLFRLHKNSIS